MALKDKLVTLEDLKIVHDEAVDLMSVLYGYDYIHPTDATGTTTYWNKTYPIDIPNGSALKLIFEGYTGSNFTRLAVYGIKSDDTQETIKTFYSNAKTEYATTTTSAYKGLYLQLVRSGAESGTTEYGLAVKVDTGVMLGHDIVSLQNEQAEARDDIGAIENALGNSLAKMYLPTEQTSVDWGQGGINTGGGSESTSTNWVRTNFFYAFSNKILYNLPSGMTLRVHEYDENRVWKKATDKIYPQKDLTLTYPYFRLTLKYTETAAITPSDVSEFTVMQDSQINENKQDIDVIKNTILYGYDYLTIPLKASTKYTNTTYNINIPQGNSFKIKYIPYIGSDFTSFVIRGYESDDTEHVIYSLYNNTLTDFEFVASDDFVRLTFQLVRNEPSSTGTEYSLIIKCDAGYMLSHDIVSLINESKGYQEDINFADVNFNQLVNAYFNLTDLGTITPGKVYGHNGKTVVDNQYCNIVSPLRITAGITYYLKNFYIYFCTVFYDDGSKVSLSPEDTSLSTKIFTAEQDGTIYLSIANEKVGTQVFTTNQSLYNSNHTETYYTPKKLLIPNANTHEYVVDKNGGGDYTNLVEAIAEAVQYENSTIHVNPGTYDILEDFDEVYGTGYINSHTFSEHDRGIELTNGVHIVFDSGAFVKCKYIRVGGNPTVRRFFSPFNVSGSCTIENLNLEAAYCRYAVHDENGGNGTPYHVIWRGCQMKLYNWNSGTAINSGETGDESPWRSKKVIGGGLGKFGDILIENCYFDIMHTDSAGITAGIVTYHNNAGSNNPGSISRVVIRNCYFKQSTFRIMYHGTTDKITQALCCGNDFSAEPSSGPSGEGQTVVNVELYSWNNHIHETPTPEDPDWWD